MKSTTIVEEDSKKEEYPVLKISDKGVIVLFTKKCTGICLNNTNGHILGLITSDWNEDIFTKLSIGEKVVLQND